MIQGGRMSSYQRKQLRSDLRWKGGFTTTYCCIKLKLSTTNFFYVQDPSKQCGFAVLVIKAVLAKNRLPFQCGVREVPANGVNTGGKSCKMLTDTLSLRQRATSQLIMGGDLIIDGRRWQKKTSRVQ